MKSPVRTAPLSFAQLAVLLGCVLVGVASALLLMPAAFRHTPTDISRIGVLLETLGDPSALPEVVVFGNSVVMSGLDMAQLSAELPGQPLAWNLSSTGQSIVESAMLAQEIPDSVSLAIYAVELRPGVKIPPLLPVKNNAYYLYGWRPTEETRDEIKRVYGDGVIWLFDRSHLSQMYKGRWALRQVLDTQMRRVLRGDLALDRAEHELFHPQRYTERMSGSALERLLTANVEGLNESPPRLVPRAGRMLHSLATRAAAVDRRTIVLLPPIHPAVFSVNEEAFRVAASEAREAVADVSKTIVIEAFTALDESHFIDDLHPTNEGARILTSLVSRQIRESF